MPTNAIMTEELTFGCEIECFVPRETAIICGGRHNGIQVPELPAGWKAETDISIHPSGGHRGVEIVSPVLKGADGFRQLAFVLEWLRGQGAKVNASCGFHCHVGFDATKGKQLARVVDLVARHELALYAATGTKSRENGTYCKSIKNDFDFARKFKDGKVPARSYDLPSDRYVSLNLANLCYGTKPTVEFRVFSGTVNTTKAFSFVRLALGIVEKAMASNRRVSWDMNATHRRRKGDGQNALAWLFLELGWMSPKHVKCGVIEMDGAPDLKATKAELVRLATKYDGGNND